MHETPLHWAARNGNVEAIETLVENGVDLNTKTIFMETPLDYAVMNNEYHALKIILELFAEMDAMAGQNKSSYELSLQLKSFSSLKTIVYTVHNLTKNTELKYQP